MMFEKGFSNCGGDGEVGRMLRLRFSISPYQKHLSQSSSMILTSDARIQADFQKRYVGLE